MFNNRYVYGNYDGLIRHDNSTTAFQKCDSEFYISLDERNKGNYIRVLVFPIESYFLNMDNYQSEDEKWNYIEDIYNAVCISLCTEYDCKLEKKTQDQWRYIESEKGVYFSASFFAGKKEFINSIVSDREKNNGQPWFVLQKCLYFGDYYIITVILTHDGTYGEFMKSDLKGDLRLKRCFQSFYQVYPVEPSLQLASHLYPLSISIIASTSVYSTPYCLQIMYVYCCIHSGKYPPLSA